MAIVSEFFFLEDYSKMVFNILNLDIKFINTNVVFLIFDFYFYQSGIILEIFYYD